MADDRTLIRRLRTAARDFRRELEVYRRALGHPDTPLPAKLLLGTAVGYALLPFDLIPDFIPVLGQLDDFLIVPLLVLAGLRLIPGGVIEECREAVARGDR